MARDDAPIGYTCPDIDGVIKDLKAVIDRLHNITGLPLNHVENEADDCANELDNLFDGSSSPLETLRSANEELRKWGNGLVLEIEGLKQEVKELEQNQCTNCQ